MNSSQTIDPKYRTKRTLKVAQVNNSTFNQVLELAVGLGARDVYITSGDYIRVRIYNERLILTDRELSHSETERLLQSGIETLDRVHNGRSTNPPYTLLRSDDVNNGQNFRLSATKFTIGKNTHYNCAIRPLPLIPPHIDNVGVAQELAEYVGKLRKGLVLLIGATGEGKTSTIAAIMRYILENVPHKRILEFSRPVENIWTRVQCHPTNQIVPHNIAEGRSGGDLVDYAEAISTAMRQAGDWIAVGEMTEAESFEAAIEFSLTGHLVSSTMHASCVYTALARIYNKTDPKTRDSLLDSLISETELMIAQILVDRVGGGMVAIRETLRHDDTVKERMREVMAHSDKPLPVLYRIVKECLWEQGGSYYQNAELLYRQSVISLETFQEVEARYGKFR